MNWVFIVNSIKGSLANKLLIYILLISFIITIITSSIVLYTDYLDQLKSQTKNLEQLKKGYSATLGHGLWHYNIETIDLQLNGILSFPNVIYAGIKAPNQQQELGNKTVVPSHASMNIHLYFKTLTITQHLTLALLLLWSINNTFIPTYWIKG